MRRVLLTALVLLTCTGCAVTTVGDLVQGLNDRSVSSCLYGRATLAPYGQAYVFARTGDLNCEALWRQILGGGL